MASFDVVVFDLDGTLADTVPDITDAINVAPQAHGLPELNASEIRAMLGDGVKVLVNRALKAVEASEEISLDAVFSTFLDYYSDHLAEKSYPWPDVENTLRQLKAEGVSISLCTNKIERLTFPFLVSMGWENIFASVVCGDTFPTQKPSPEPLIEAVHRAGGGRALFVGDTIVDLATANAANIPCVIVDIEGLWQKNTTINKLSPYNIISKFKDLLAIVNEPIYEPNVRN